MPNRKVYGKQKDSMAKQLYDEHSLTVPSSKSDCSLQQCGCGEGADGMDGWCGCRWGAAQKGYVLDFTKTIQTQIPLQFSIGLDPAQSLSDGF